ncbi:MAG TPA: transporter [Bacteroidota bacterium]|nr:transporter [Bacteroidota bacterium]
MRRFVPRAQRFLAIIVLLVPASVYTAHAQLSTVFSNIFSEVLDTRLQLSPGRHANHFVPAANKANAELVPGLNSLITGDISSFPLSTTSPRVGFDFSSGRPVAVTGSLGPILAETADPVGKGRLMIELSYTYLDLDEFRGLPTDQMQFTFTHVSVTPGEPALGENTNESDLINLVMDLHTRVSIGALTATWGVTDNFDISVAIPVISVRLNGTAKATIDSYTFASGGAAHHFFGGDSLNPVLATTVPYDQSATGIGDVALRLKYNISQGSGLNAAALLDIRLPSGRVADFLGSGRPTYRLWGIFSGTMGDVTPHLNLAYAHKIAALQSDAIEFRAGFDNKLSSKMTFALDLLGQIDLNPDKAIHLAPGTTTIIDRIDSVRDNPSSGRLPNVQSVRTVSLSNIPDLNNDDTISLAAGFRYAPSESVMIFVDILAPLNSRGLRAPLAPTVGLSASL